MRRSVAALVKSKTRHFNQPIEVSPFQGNVERLEKELAEVKRSYEHQIDLLHSSMGKSKQEVHQLNLEMDRKLEEMRAAYLEFEDLRVEYGRLKEEHFNLLKEATEELSKKDSLINEYQRTISEQRMIIEKKQRYIAKLEGKVRDLMYEIRSLLQLEEPPRHLEEDLPTQPLYDLSFQLHQLIEKAESLTGMDHLSVGKSPRFLSSESYAIDQRPLFDRFGDEASGIIFIYSSVDERFLFVNNHVKTVLGWSPEKFGKEFHRLVLSGFAEWKSALSKLPLARESELPLVIEDRMGKQRTFHCSMGMISKGPFGNHVIGLLKI